MLTHLCTRRRFMASTSLIIAAGAFPIAKLGWSGTQSTSMLVSAEHAARSGLSSRAVLLDGPRIERLRTMTASLSNGAGEIFLSLDPTDDHLLDIAAEQAGVSIRRGSALPDGKGIRAYVISHQRSLG